MSALPSPARAQEQLQALGRAARLLAAASDFQDTLRQTLAACMPTVADFGFFDVVVAPGEVLRTVAAHDAPDIEALLAPTRWVARHHPELNLCALSTGEAAVHPHTDSAWYRRIAADEGHVALLEALGFRSMLTVPVRYREELVGALTLFMGRSRRRHGEADLAFASDLASLAAPVVVNARLVEQHRRARAEAEAARRRFELLAAASSALATSLDTEDTLGAIARAIVPEVADWCRIDLVDEAGHLQRRLAYHSDPERSREALAYARQVRAAPQTTGSMAWCAEQGRSHYGKFDEPPAVHDAALRDFTQHFGMREHYIMPLVARGRTLGAMGVVQAESGRTLTPEDRAFVEELGRRAALALDNASAYAAAGSARKRLELLADASSALARSLDTEDTLRTIATTLVPAVADWCRIDLLDDAGVQHRRISYHSDPDRAEAALALARELQVTADVEGSMAWCIARREPSYGRFDQPPVSEDAALRRFNQVFGMTAYYVVPLVARGRTLGGLRVTQAESGRDLTEPDRALVLELGRRAAMALDNAHAYAEAESARRQAEAASRAKDEFLAMLGHELRNPLAPIATALELMLRRDPHAHVEERRIIGRQVSHMSRLIDDLLDVSRITQGKVELKREPVDMRVVVAHAVEQTQPIFERRAAPVELRLPERPVTVQGDAVRLTQVLCNLLVNAAKFTPPQGRIALSLAARGGDAVVEVEDAGRGIGPELLPDVFELFVQGRQSLDRQAGGLGLGLAIVKKLVERHGGRVAAHSEGEGRGSRFTVTLPRVDAPVPIAVREAPAAAAPSGLRLMIVDDNSDAAETLAELLRVVGCEVRCAGDGESALRLLDNYRPQLALLDIGLPGLDGYELAGRMRDDPRNHGVKLVALTGYGRENDRARALASRFDEHLVKPVAADRLFRTLSDLLGVPL